MRQTFRGFYSDESRIEEVLQSEDTRIILDTNVLLNLYNYHDQTREKFFETLKKLEDKLWLPYHVVLEYQRRRVAVLRREKKKFHLLKGTADSCLEELGKVRDQALFKRIPEVATITEEYKEKLKPILEEYKDKIEELNKSQLAAPKNDPIRGEITELFDGRVGSAPSKEDLKELIAEGEKRIKAKIPPGYRDEKKDKSETPEFYYAGLTYQNKFGDFIIWKQIIKMANAASDQVRNIVFVTDDGKEDWWHLDQSSKKEKIGARAELREEICDEGGVEHFSMYDSAAFLELASKSVDVEVDEASLDDVKSQIKVAGQLSKYVVNTAIAAALSRLESNMRKIGDASDFLDEKEGLEGKAIIFNVVTSPYVQEYIESFIAPSHWESCRNFVCQRMYDDFLDYGFEEDTEEDLYNYAIEFVKIYHAELLES